MSARVETRMVLRCDLCGWEVCSRSAESYEALRAAAAKQDGWTVQNDKDLCGDHRRYVEPEGAGT